MTPFKYMKLYMAGRLTELTISINSLSHPERIRLRVKLEKMGCRHLIRNLYYDYAKQAWIDYVGNILEEGRFIPIKNHSKE